MSTSDGSNDFKYITVEDVPLTGPDPYSNDRKRAAIESAEAKLEADVNDGRQIDSPEAIHQLAVNAWTSYILALGPKDPGSATLGDMADEGASRTAFADHLLAIYRDVVESISDAAADEGHEGGDEPAGGSGTRDPTFGLETY